MIRIARDEAIYAGMIRADCSYKELKSQNETLAKIYGDLQLLKRNLEAVAEKQLGQEEGLNVLNGMIGEFISESRTHFWILAILLLVMMIIILLLNIILHGNEVC